MIAVVLRLNVLFPSFFSLSSRFIIVEAISINFLRELLFSGVELWLEMLMMLWCGKFKNRDSFSCTRNIHSLPGEYWNIWASKGNKMKLLALYCVINIQFLPLLQIEFNFTFLSYCFLNLDLNFLLCNSNAQKSKKVETSRLPKTGNDMI